MKRSIAILIAAILGLALTGCGSTPSQAKLSSNQLLAKARAYVSSHQDVSLSGKIDQGGGETSLDLKYSGENSFGTIKLSGATIDLESIGGTTYFKPSKEFWTQQLPQAQADLVSKLIGDRWIIADPANANFAQLIEVAKRSFLVDTVLTPDGKATKGKVTTISGVKAIPLSLARGAIYLADSDARPLQIKGSGSGGSGTAVFTYDKVSMPAAPTAKEQVDLSKLMASK